jgi:hypothetical protein
MTEIYLRESTSLALLGAAWLSCGVLIGAMHLLMLRRNVKLFVAGAAPLLAIALQLGRLALLAGALALIVGRFGAFPLLTATAGIVVARTAALRTGERA